MKLIPGLISAVITIGLIVALNMPVGPIPPVGKFFSPQHGFWLNAETEGEMEDLILQNLPLKQPATVYFDNRLVPHVFANNDHDAIMIQGYLHAKYRLWQMEFQTFAAGGRLSEILGAGPDSIYLKNDRNMRRMGMVYGASQSLKAMESDPVTSEIIQAYTRGVNARIDELQLKDLPLEYRLLNYNPGHWTNMKTALFLMYMSYDLTGYDNDIEMTNAKAVVNKAMLDIMYPAFPDSLDPVISKGTIYPQAGINPVPPANADSLYFNYPDSVSIHATKPDKNNGSNNWVVSGSKTVSGAPILCNDPHLGVNLPALWYEIQLTTPGYSVYGVSFPGAPGVIIGFNRDIAWGVTNASRDVKDYYKIKFRNKDKKEYFFNNEWVKTDLKVEKFEIKGSPPFYDTVAYTVFGPVMYEPGVSYSSTANDYLAVKWKAHEATNELKTFILLNKARDLNDFKEAISTYSCPGQNFVFAGRSNDIAIWQQGSFPARWKGQGQFIMPGDDSNYLWQGDIPFEENPHEINPERGFVSSANQLPADQAYPYDLLGDYDLYRGYQINKLLNARNDFTADLMKAMQMNNVNPLAKTILPFMLRNLNDSVLDENERHFYNILSNWNFKNERKETGATAFFLWFEDLKYEVWEDELSIIPAPRLKPEDYTLAELLLRDSANAFIDNINTDEQETIQELLLRSFKATVLKLNTVYKERQQWSDFKNAGVRHLLRLEPLSRYNLATDGGQHIINAGKQYHAPSWRMVVHMTENIEAYGIYPGGQSGNPGSQYYDGFVNNWAAGRYYTLWFMKEEEKNSNKVISTIQFR